MAKTYSEMVALGTNAPAFSLPDTVSGKNITMQDVKGKNGTMVMFICNHCPYVVHINEEIVKLANEYLQKGIGFLAICANDKVAYPDDAPDKMKARALKLQYPFPYCFDES